MGRNQSPQHWQWSADVILKIVWQFFKMLDVQLPYDPAIPHLGVPREMKTYLSKKLLRECS